MFSAKINAQENENHNLQIGAYLMTPKISHNINHLAQQFVLFYGIVDFGISGFYPLNQNKDVAALLEFGYANYAFAVNDSDVLQFNTINISPQIYLKGFTVGFDFGFFFPPNLLNVSSSQYDYDNRLKYPYLLNLKLGGKIPVYKTDSGTLNILLKGTTSLSYIGGDSFFFRADKIQILSFSAGINYMFNVRF
jgi:hypothetical protein